MRVHADEKVLQHQRVPVCSAIKRGFPTEGCRLALTPVVKRGEIAVGKDYVESLHARAVLKATGSNSLLYRFGHSTIKRREVTGTILLLVGPFDNGIE